MAFGRRTDGTTNPARNSLASLATLSPFLLLSWAGWLIVLGGLAALQHRCLSDSDVGAAGLLGQYDPNPACKSLYRYTWFVWCLEFVVLVALTFASFAFHLGGRLSWIGPLTVVTVLIIDQCNRYISFRAIVGGGVKSAAQCVFAGWIITAVGNFLMLIAYGWLLDQKFGGMYGNDVEGGMTGVGAGFRGRKAATTTGAVPEATPATGGAVV